MHWFLRTHTCIECGVPSFHIHNSRCPDCNEKIRKQQQQHEIDMVWEEAAEENWAFDMNSENGPGMSWDYPLVIEDEEVYIVYEGECNMCGRERNINDSGYCSQCWQVWNG